MFNIHVNHCQALKLKQLMIKYNYLIFDPMLRTIFNALKLLPQYNQLIWIKLIGSGLRILLKTVNLECSILSN